MLQGCLPSTPSLSCFLSICTMEGTEGQRRVRGARPWDSSECFLGREGNAYQAVSREIKFPTSHIDLTTVFFVLCISTLEKATWGEGKSRALRRKTSDFKFWLYHPVKVSPWASPLMSLKLSFFLPSNENSNLWPLSFQGYGEHDKRKGIWKSLSTAEDERFLLLENMSSGQTQSPHDLLERLRIRMVFNTSITIVLLLLINL